MRYNPHKGVPFSSCPEYSLTLFRGGGGGEGPGGRPGDGGHGAPGHRASHDERRHHDFVNSQELIDALKSQGLVFDPTVPCDYLNQASVELYSQFYTINITFYSFWPTFTSKRFIKD